MKTVILSAVFVIASAVVTLAQKSEINRSKSSVEWTGNKIGGSHNGTISIKSGYLEFKNNQITGGEVIIDMATITNTDLKDESYNQKLVGHLKSDDFFGVTNFPTSAFVITKASKFTKGKATVTGKLSIKGKTEMITFDVIKNGSVYTAQIEVDRSKYNVRYGSNSFFDNLGDKAIDDIFVLDVKLAL